MPATERPSEQGYDRMHAHVYVREYVSDGQRGSVLPRWCDPSSLRTRASARGLDHSRRGKTLGEGGFGFVYLAKHTQTGKDYALKRMIGQDADSTQLARAELAQLGRLGHGTACQ